jgi:hypothetical protein
MSERLVQVGSSENPEVILDPEQEKYLISGDSLPEDIKVVYMPIVDWFKENCSSLEHDIHLVVDLNYINSTSSKALMDVFVTLEQETLNSTNPAKIHWIYDEDDSDNQQLGISYKEMLKIPFYLEPK